MAGLLNASLVIPIFHLNSVWRDSRLKSTFHYLIYNFIDFINRRKICFFFFWLKYQYNSISVLDCSLNWFPWLENYELKILSMTLPVSLFNSLLEHDHSCSSSYYRFPSFSCLCFHLFPEIHISAVNIDYFRLYIFLKEKQSDFSFIGNRTL